MNKKKTIIPVLTCMTLSAALLSGCNAAPTAIGLSANWNKDTTIKNIDVTAGVMEKLEYEITFEAPSKPKEYAANYGTGSYTTTLSTVLYEGKHCYTYETVYEIGVSFTVNGETSQTYTDHIESKVWFSDLDGALCPLKSEKSGHTYTPLTGTPQSLDAAYYIYYDYTFTVDYDSPLTQATINKTVKERYSNQTEDKAVTKTIENKKTNVSADNFFDNEQLLFVLRAFDMLSAETVNTVNPDTGNTEKLSLAAPTAVSQAVNFTIKNADGTTTQVGGDGGENIDAYSTTLGMDGTMRGNANTLIYAAKTNPLDNTYRNVLLKREVALFSNLGTLIYTLKTAEFTA